jgi:hypothetical protein
MLWLLFAVAAARYFLYKPRPTFSLIIETGGAGAFMAGMACATSKIAPIPGILPKKSRQSHFGGEQHDGHNATSFLARPQCPSATSLHVHGRGAAASPS